MNTLAEVLAELADDDRLGYLDAVAALGPAVRPAIPTVWDLDEIPVERSVA